MAEFNFRIESSVGFDIAFERNFFLVNFDSELFFDFCRNVGCGDGTEELSAVSGNAGEFNGFFLDNRGGIHCGLFFKGKFALNICPNEDTMGELKKYAAYAEKAIDQDGKETVKKTAKDMCVMLFDLQDTEASFEYEALLYVVHIIEKCVAA